MKSCLPINQAYTQILTTERLFLKPLSEDVLVECFEYFTEDIVKYMQSAVPKSIEDTIEFINAMKKKRAKYESFVYALHSKQNNEFLGCVALHNLKKEIPELGVWIKISAHGHGYGGEAVHGLVEFAKQLGYRKLEYPVDCRNTSSKKIPLSLGGYLAKEHLIEKSRDGRELDMEVYRIDI